MPVGITITMTRQNPPREKVFKGIITDRDWGYLVGFRGETQRLARAEWVAAGMNGGFHVSFSVGDGLRVETPNKPSDAQVAEVLQSLRPFILQERGVVLRQSHGGF